MLDLDRKQDITGDIVFLLQENWRKTELFVGCLWAGRGRAILSVALPCQGSIHLIFLSKSLLSEELYDSFYIIMLVWSCIILMKI